MKLHQTYAAAALGLCLTAAFPPQAAYSDVITFEQISPNPATYVLGTDFSVLTLSGFGNVTASNSASCQSGMWWW